MEDTFALEELRPGQRARVRALGCAGRLRRRLLDLGLVEGATIECLGLSPGGDPKAFLVCGAVLALRSEDCRDIRVYWQAQGEEP